MGWPGCWTTIVGTGVAGLWTVLVGTVLGLFLRNFDHALLCSPFRSARFLRKPDSPKDPRLVAVAKTRCFRYDWSRE